MLHYYNKSRPKTMESRPKTIEKNQEDIKSIEGIFPKDMRTN